MWRAIREKVFDPTHSQTLECSVRQSDGGSVHALAFAVSSAPPCRKAINDLSMARNRGGFDLIHHRPLAFLP